MNIKLKILFLFIVIFFGNSLIKAQGVLPIQRYIVPKGPFDAISETPTFGYSFRKLSNSYTGFPCKVRRNNDNAEANVAFDVSNLLTANSIVTVTAVGTSSLTIGQQLTLNTFKGANRIFVSTWYNQGNVAFNAIQTTNANQPELMLNSVGTGNTKPSLLFDGTDFLRIQQPMESILNNGINGSFMIAVKSTANSNHFTFGYRKNTNPNSNWRWSFHINWSDGYTYFDAAEVCCATNRRFFNSANINQWKQYSFIRGTTYKTARVSGTTTALNNSPATSIAMTGGEFQIGSALNNPNGLFQGSISELLMFPTDLSIPNATIVEQNQINYWNL